jgi:hypothetical protein
VRRSGRKFWVVNGELAGEVACTLAGFDLQRPAGEVLDNVNRARGDQRR